MTPPSKARFRAAYDNPNSNREVYSYSAQLRQRLPARAVSEMPAFWLAWMSGVLDGRIYESKRRPRGVRFAYALNGFCQRSRIKHRNEQFFL